MIGDEDRYKTRLKMRTDLGKVCSTLDAAKKYGLEAEVMWSALTLAAEANEHGKTMQQVLSEALEEWDI